MIAACSGGAGDIIYSIPILKQLGASTLYIKENFYHPPHGNLHQTMKRMMESQGFEVRPCSGSFPVGTFDKVPYDYNIDKFRDQKGRGTRHIQERMATHFGVEWIKGQWVDIPTTAGDYTLVHLTERWRTGSVVNWKKVLHRIEGPVKFIGFQHEWLEFGVNVGNVEWWPCEDVYEMAELIAGCKALYCNQSVALTLAQGMGKEYYLDRKAGRTNTLLYTTNEHLL